MLNIEITPEDVMALSKEWKAALLASIPIEEVLSHYTLEELLSDLTPEEWLRAIEPYIEEQKEVAESQVLVRIILRRLQERFNLPPETLDNVASRLQPFTLIELEALNEVAVKAQKLF